MKKSDSWGRVLNLFPWDGSCPGISDKYPYPDNLLQDNDGNIYYTPYGSETVSMWCSASRLRDHLHHLFQVFAR